MPETVLAEVIWLEHHREHTPCPLSSILSPAASLAADARVPRDASLSLATSGDIIRYTGWEVDWISDVLLLVSFEAPDTACWADSDT